MRDESKARQEGRDAVQVWFASTVASERQQWQDQGINLGLAEGIVRGTKAKTHGREFKRHETTPID
jgi:hypothetical protein